ncbi:hypothetical protein ND00_30680 [Clostridium sp. L74]|nr:hypothetical protein ND00_30680 [Clostridium sp. L74]
MKYGYLMIFLKKNTERCWEIYIYIIIYSLYFGIVFAFI